MKILGAVCCCARDQHMIPHFLESWHRAYEIDVVFLNDVKSPAVIPSGYDQYELNWPNRGALANPVMESLANVVLARNLDAIIKLDVDCIHRRIDGKAWIDEYSLDYAAYGVEHVKYDDCFIGASYVLRADALCKAAFTGEACKCRPEDVGVARAMRKAFPDEIKIIPAENKKMCGYWPDSEFNKYRKYEIIHCGQKIHRSKVPGLMARFNRDL